jgi:hypothetical protein
VPPPPPNGGGGDVCVDDVALDVVDVVVDAIDDVLDTGGGGETLCDRRILADAGFRSGNCLGMATPVIWMRFGPVTVVAVARRCVAPAADLVFATEPTASPAAKPASNSMLTRANCRMLGACCTVGAEVRGRPPLCDGICLSGASLVAYIVNISVLAW